MNTDIKATNFFSIDSFDSLHQSVLICGSFVRYHLGEFFDDDCWVFCPYDFDFELLAWFGFSSSFVV